MIICYGILTSCPRCDYRVILCVLCLELEASCFRINTMDECNCNSGVTPSTHGIQFQLGTTTVFRVTHPIRQCLITPSAAYPRPLAILAHRLLSLPQKIRGECFHLFTDFCEQKGRTLALDYGVIDVSGVPLLSIHHNRNKIICNIDHLMAFHGSAPSVFAVCQHSAESERSQMPRNAAT